MGSKNPWDNPAGIYTDVPVLTSGLVVGSSATPLETIYVNNILPGSGGGTGTFVADGTEDVVVLNTSWTTNSVLATGIKTVGGTPGAVYVADSNPGVSFTIRSTDNLDTSTYNYRIFN